MKTHQIEILRVGTWNGQPFELSDLESIVASFRELELAGRVPVGLGHQRRDTEQAEAWIVRLTLADDVLIADVEIVREALLDDIKLGKFRNVSVELLSDVKRGSKEYKWVLCGLAVLGAAPPAVIGLKPLTDLVASALFKDATSAGVLKFSQRLRDRGDEARLRAERDARLRAEGEARLRAESEARLKAENAALTARLIDEKFNAAIEAGRILPRDREAFRKRFGASATVAEAETWIATSPRPAESARQSTRRSAPEQPAGAPDEQLVALAKEAMRAARLDGEPITFDQAAVQVMKANPDLAKQWQTMPSDLYGHGQ